MPERDLEPRKVKSLLSEELDHRFNGTKPCPVAVVGEDPGDDGQQDVDMESTMTDYEYWEACLGGESTASWVAHSIITDKSRGHKTASRMFLRSPLWNEVTFADSAADVREVPDEPVREPHAVSILPQANGEIDGGVVPWVADMGHAAGADFGNFAMGAVFDEDEAMDGEEDGQVVDNDSGFGRGAHIKFGFF